MDPTTTPAVESARLFLQHVEKLAKTADLYGGSGVLVDRACLEALVALKAALRGASLLDLKVLPYEFTLEDASVYKNVDTTRSLAFVLYRDGVRRISFHAGLTPVELMDLMRILRTDLRAHPEESVVTLLWTRNFRGVSYHAIEDFFQTEDAFQQDPYDAESVVEAIRRPMKATMGGSTLSLSSQDLENVVGNALAPAARDVHKASIFELGGVEISELRAEADEPATLRLERFLEAVLAVLADDREPKELEKRLGVLAQLHHDLAMAGNVAAATMLAVRLRGLAKSMAYGGAMDRATLVNGAVDALLTPALAARAMAAMTQEELRPAVLEHLTALGESAVAPMAAVLSPSTPEPVRTSLVSLLERLVSGRLDVLLPAINVPAPPVDLVMMLGRIQDGRVPGLLAKLAAGLDEEVVLAAIHAMAADYRPEYTPLLLRVLEDADGATRMAILRTLGTSNDVRVADLILRRVRVRGFQRLSVMEKRAHFLVVALAGGDKALPQIKAVLAKRGWLTGLPLETRHSAIHAVGTLATQAALDLLEEELARAGKDVAGQALCVRLAAEVRQRMAAAATARDVRAGQQLTLEESTRFSIKDIPLVAPEDEPDPAVLAELVDLSMSARKRILVNHARLSTMSHYEVLGVTPSASMEEIQAAATLLAARFAPERYQGRHLGSFGQRITAIRRAAERARDVLLNEQKRRRYDDELKTAAAARKR